MAKNVPTDPFAALIDQAEIVDAGPRTFRGEIPESVRGLVKRAAAESKRVTLPVQDKGQFNELKAVFTAAANEIEMSLYTKALTNDPENEERISHIQFTLGAKRGRKSPQTTAPGTEADGATESDHFAE